MKMNTPGTLVVIITPAGWLALGGGALISAVLIAWCFCGHISETVTGRGMLLDVGGLDSIVSVADGKISYLAVEVGDYVVEGQPVARIQQPGLLEKINQTKKQVVLLREFLARLKELYKEKQEKNQKYVKSLEKYMATNIKHLSDTRQSYQEMRDIYKLLLEHAVIPKATYLRAVREHLNSEIILNNSKSMRLEIPFHMYLTEFSDNRIIMDAQIQLSTLSYELESLQEKFKHYSVVCSPTDGFIRELNTYEGDIVKTGDILMMLSNEKNQTLELVAFLSPYMGKNVKIGMSGKIAPSIVRPEKYGYLKGTVTFVSDYPEGPQALMARIKNMKLSEELSQGKPAICVLLETYPDENTPSKLKWTSSNGPPFRLSPGTLCSVRITYQSMAPVAYVIPMLKEFFGIE